MAFTLQNNTGLVVDANAYIDVAFYKDYWKDRGVTVTQGTGAIQAAIIEATQFVDYVNRYGGIPLTDGQATEFPRDALYDARGIAIEGLPFVLKAATAELAKKHIDGTPLFPDEDFNAAGKVTGKTVKAAVVEISTQYAEHAGGGRLPSFPKIEHMLAPLLAGGGGTQSEAIVG